ncbi:MAG: aldo/keto reductase [Gemmatimonadaceae bacterium]
MEVLMKYRTFGRLGWRVSEVGHGMWGMGSWSGSDDDESREALAESVRLGCTFFDTAWVYGEGHSETLLGELLRAHGNTHDRERLYVATKIPPLNYEWPARADAELSEVFPLDHIREYTERSLENLGVERVDLMQFHVWNDAWAHDDRWRRAMEELKREGMIGGVGISINDLEPWNALDTLRTGAVDAVQVIHNIFEQAPEDELFPLCRELGIAVIARVPFDEGSLTGTLTRDSTWPAGDFRSAYFAGGALDETLDRVEAMDRALPAGASLPETALRFILSHDAVSTVIPGMRRPHHVRANLAASDAGPLPAEVLRQLREFRWDRGPSRG